MNDENIDEWCYKLSWRINCSTVVARVIYHLSREKSLRWNAPIFVEHAKSNDVILNTRSEKRDKVKFSWMCEKVYLPSQFLSKISASAHGGIVQKSTIEPIWNQNFNRFGAAINWKIFKS